MKNIDIIKLGNGGFLAATGHSLPVEHFYKFVKFKRAVQKAYEAASKAQGDFLTEAGLTYADLQPGAKPDKEKAERYNALNTAMIAEAVEMPAVKIPQEFYKGLYDENKTGRGDIFANMDVEEIVLAELFTEE
jgi:hypothetical protein